MLPEYDAVIVDEAHELAARVTQASTDELDPVVVERAARRARVQVEGKEADDLTDASDALADVLARTDEGRIDDPPQPLREVLAFVRDAARACLSAFPKDKDKGEPDAARQQSRGMVDDVRKIAERMAAKGETEVLWMSDNRGNKQLHIAPIDVSASLRDKLFGDKTVVLTSATLKLGGGFDPVARSLGLEPVTTRGARSTSARRSTTASRACSTSPATCRCRAATASRRRSSPRSPRSSRPPADVRSGCSRRVALPRRRLKRYARRLPDIDIWCQGDAQLPELARRFAETPSTCLFGTLSLWQGVDLPGDTCQLVIIDRVPFPRPDDPLMSARQRLVEKRGGNGFMSVAASHAALLLAQGTGRLIRRATDKGVVAILDPRIVTARYGSFLAASLPDMWRTTDRDVALAALRRLDKAANAATTAEV